MPNASVRATPRASPTATAGLVACGAAVAAAGIVTTTGVKPILGLLAVLGAGTMIVVALHRFEWFILGLIVIRSSVDVAKTSYGMPDVAGALAVLMIGTSLVWLALNWHRTLPPQSPGRPPRVSLLSVGVLGFTIASIISVAVSSQPTTSVAGTMRIMAAALMFFVVRRLLQLGMPTSHLVGAIAASVVVPLAATFIGSRIGVSITHEKDGIEVLRSTFFRSNNFAHYLMVIMLLALALIRYLRGWQRWAAVAIVAVGSYQLVETSTRGAWFGFAVGVVVIALVDNRLIGLVALVVGSLAVVAVPAVADRISSIEADAEAPRQEGSLAWRFGHWEEIIPLRDDNPLTGIGLGMTAELSGEQNSPHSDYLLAMVETGYFGLAGYLALVVGFIWASIKLLAISRSSGRARGLAVGALAVSFAFAADSIADNLITGLALTWYVMPLAACVDWLRQTHRSNETVIAGPIRAEVEQRTSGAERASA